MKKLFAVLFLCNMVFLPRAVASDRDEAFLTKRFPVAAVSVLHVTTSGGSVEVQGTATEEAIVEVFISPNNSAKWPAEKILSVLDEYYELDITAESGTLTAHAKRKDGAKRSSKADLGISFRITAPRAVDGQVRTSGGSIKLSDVSGTLQFTTSGGSIKAEDCSGTVTLITSGGSIKLDGLSGSIAAMTSGGSVRADNITGALQATTSGGSMILEEISGNLEARTSGGTIKVDMAAVGDYVRLHNSGNIDLAVPGGGYALSLQGRKIETPQLDGFSGTFESKNISGTLSGGGPELAVKSSQRVRLTFK
jgi:hypothetical protein